MSSIVKFTAVAAVLTTLVACGGRQQEEVVIIDPAPVMVEPVSGKF